MLQQRIESLRNFVPLRPKKSEKFFVNPTKERPNLSNHIQLLLKQEFLKKPLKRSRTKPLESKNSIWDITKLIERFTLDEYQTDQSRIDLLRADAVHHAKEMALVEAVTRFSYYYSQESDELFGDGYNEDILVLLNNFSQDLASKGVDSTRASVEHLAFGQVKKSLYDVAKNKTEAGLSNHAILITSFPDEKSSGYHGVNSKYNWDKKENHHSFFYLARVGKIDRDEGGNIAGFEIITTQYRLWPNARQTLELHKLLEKPINLPSGQIPNQFFANLIPVDVEMIKKIAPKEDLGPIDNDEDELEHNLRKLLFKESSKHAIDHTKAPDIDLKEFWNIQEKYFNEFYLRVALPAFKEIDIIKASKTELSVRKYNKLIQEKIDYLDKAFFYYSKILVSWIKDNNQNPEYEAAFKDKSKINALKSFQQKLLLKLLGQEEIKGLPKPEELVQVLNIDHKLAITGKISKLEKKKLLNTWGFFSSVENLGSLLQCGAMTPFTMPISLMNQGFNPSSITSFSASLSEVPLPQKKELLSALTSEEYVELDLTGQGAIKVYTVPKNYLDGKGCVVGENGQVLGPCIDPETKERIPLDDLRDTLAYPMNLIEFNKYMAALKQNINEKSIDTLEEIFTDETFSIKDQQLAKKTISLLRKKIIKDSLTLNDLFVGDVIKKLSDQNEWLQDLILQLAFSINPVKVLIFEVNNKIKTDPDFFELEFEEDKDSETSTNLS